MKISEIRQLMKRRKSARKGDSGKVLIVGGSKEYAGALALAGLAALRSGCDWVTVACPSKVGWAVESLSMDLVVHKVKGDYLMLKHVNSLVTLSKNFDVVLLGIGMTAKGKAFCTSFNRKLGDRLKVIDADGIKALSVQECRNSLFTPHTGEFALLMKNSKIRTGDGDTIKKLQRHLGDNVVLVKGDADKMVSSSTIKRISGGNPGLAKAGTGDVLAGLCAGFLAQCKDLWKAGEAGATVNKHIGDILLKKKKGYSFIASDMVEEMKRVLK